MTSRIMTLEKVGGVPSTFSLRWDSTYRCVSQLCSRQRYRCSSAPKFEGFRARCSDGGRSVPNDSMLSFQTLLLLLACASSHASQGAVHLVEDDVEVLGSSVLLSTLDDPDSTTLVDPEAEASALSDDDDEASSASATPLSFLSSLFAPSWLPDDDDHTSFRRLEEAKKKPKRKFCNTTLAGGFKGDYAYEACGTFCKAEKAQNHCKFCKCKACGFCSAMKGTSASKKPTTTASSPTTPAKKGMKKGGLGKGKGKGSSLFAKSMKASPQMKALKKKKKAEKLMRKQRKE